MSIKKRISVLLALAFAICVLGSLISVTAFADEATPPPCTHTYDNDCDAECNACHAKREASHKYADECDTECDDCKATRTAPHKYDNDCDAECNLCKTKRTPKAHVYDNDQDTACNVCLATRTVKSPAQIWWDNNNQIIAYIIAGIIFVAGAVGIFFWIPKNKDSKKKSYRK